MTFASFALAALALQQPAAPQTPALPIVPASPIARIALTPARPVVTKLDSLRLTAVALDAAGQPVPNATIRYFSAGGRFEASIDSTGMVRHVDPDASRVVRRDSRCERVPTQALPRVGPGRWSRRGR